MGRRHDDRADPSGASTVPPPFDPAQFARDSERSMRAADPQQSRETTQMAPLPPLTAVVRVTASKADLDSYELSPVARALAAHIDGKKTMLDLLAFGNPTDTIKAFAELHDAGLLGYD